MPRRKRSLEEKQKEARERNHARRRAQLLKSRREAMAYARARRKKIGNDNLRSKRVQYEILDTSYCIPEEVFDIPHLDLSFVGWGVSKGPFACLSPYHRYILYLYYGLGLSIYDTAKVIQKDRIRIMKELDWIREKIRLHWN